MIGGYVQDSWTLKDRLTLNLGLRYEHMEYTIPKQGQDRAAVVYQGKTYDPSVAESFTPVNWNTIAPRLAASYALTRDNKTVLKASFGRYYAKMATNFYSAANPNGPMTWRQGLNPDWTLKGDPYLFTAQAEALIDPDIKPYYTDEVTFGIERELFEDMKLGIRYIQKWDRDLVEDINTNALDMDAFRRGEIVWLNYDPFTATDPYNGQPVTFWGVRDTAVTFGQYITNPPGADRDYQAIEVTFNKKFSHRWQMISSYVYAKSENLVAMTGANSGLWNNPNPMINAFGRDPRVPRHQVKVQGSYAGPWGINISGYFYAFMSTPMTRTIRSADLGLSLKQGNTTIYAEPKGSSRLPDLAIFDFRLDKSIKLPGKLGKIELILDILNLFNANTATATEAVSSSPALFTYGAMTAITDPRIFRLAVRYDF
jgi:outer membrane receptor protein involved in Fe transport